MCGDVFSIKWPISEITTRNLLLSRPLRIISAVTVKMLIVSVVHIRCVVYCILHDVKSKLSAWCSRNWLSLPVFHLTLCPTIVKSKFEMLSYDFIAGLNSCLQCYDTNMQCHGIMEISCWIFCLIHYNDWGLFMHALSFCVANKSKSLEFKSDEWADRNPCLITCLPVASPYTFIDLVDVWAISLSCF
jgi:hypothetical protein